MLVQLTTVHPRTDTRIAVKIVRSLAHAYPGCVHLVVADGKGSETRDGVRVHDLGKPRGRLSRMLNGSLRALRSVRRIDPDIVHFHDPELLPLGMILRVLGYQVLYDVHEDVPEIITTRAWIPRLLRAPLAKMVDVIERTAARVACRVVSATPHIARRFPADRTTLVQNFPRPDELVPMDSEPMAGRGPTFVYVGAITERRGAREIVSALSILNQRKNGALLLMGPVRPAELLADLERSSGWKWVEYGGWASRFDVARAFSRALAGLVMFRDSPNHPKSQPNKLFEYMSAGLPVIATDFGFWRELVGRFDCCLFVPPEPAEIATAMDWLITHPEEAAAMGRRGRRAVEEVFNWSCEEARLLELYDRLLAGRES